MCTAQNAVHFETVGSRRNAGLFHTDVENTFVPENAAHFETIGSTGNIGLFQDDVESSDFDALCLAFQNFKEPFTWIELKPGNRQKKSDRISQTQPQFKNRRTSHRAHVDSENVHGNAMIQSTNDAMLHFAKQSSN